MKIKITQPGYEQFTGFFGVVEFANGVSVGDVAPIEAQRLASIVQVENEEGHNPSVAQTIIDTYAERMGHATLPEADPSTPTTPAPERRYAADELAAVADEDGIKGLRAIAEPLGLKANSIAELIGKILAVAGPVDQPAEIVPAEEAQEQAAAEEVAQAVVDAAVEAPVDAAAAE